MTPSRAAALLARLAWPDADADAGCTGHRADEPARGHPQGATPGLVIKGYVVDPADLPAIEGLLERWPAPAAVQR